MCINKIKNLIRYALSSHGGINKTSFSLLASSEQSLLRDVANEAQQLSGEAIKLQVCVFGSRAFVQAKAHGAALHKGLENIS
jgi:hypothetical protein